MEIKATLNKPYTDKERSDFIVEYNHKRGFVITEDENGIYANEPVISEDELKLQRIAELKKYLSETDYVSCKLIEALDEAELQDLKEKYKDVLKQRREARAEINKLEA